ncbi:MAG: efflux RND transporter periplasmic adaptor subunit [Antarcticimicrobium sp.]|uniref:efflux RND transporter periplasmic adaptor subunit n=1 Tax=Antarcticimicrobium sp. TaxID=2824147 RepID=UPI0026133037|nr:efflux RND transporter periplasmic adaptor subunit [Antarcticimicrobium sp.]MDF1716489.1 efflux RND transporter periplasmic adaptor subunit [Antarcticimicrobium sp.]
MNSNSKNRNWKRIASVIVLVATAALAVPFLPVAVTDVFAQTEMYGGESDPDATEAPQYDRPVTVEVTRALSRVINQSRAVAGRVEPARTVDIAFQVPGQIISLYVEPGDRIGEGDVIAELDQADFDLAVDRAQASFDLAKSEFERANSLAERGVAADARLDTARAQFAQADVALREARRRLSQTRIVAPFDAIVARTFVEEYVNVTSAAPVARLQDVSETRIMISLPEELAAIARSAPDGFDIVSSFPAVPGYTAPLVLRSFATDADPTAQTYDVEFAITGDIDPRLLPGMTAEVRISIAAEGDHQQSVIVPVSAVDTTSRTEPSIWIYEDQSGQVARRTVRLGLPINDEIVVLDGLKGDELVVSGGWWRLRDNQTVTVSGH